MVKFAVMQATKILSNKPVKTDTFGCKYPPSLLTHGLKTTCLILLGGGLVPCSRCQVDWKAGVPSWLLALVPVQSYQLLPIDKSTIFFSME